MLITAASAVAEIGAGPSAPPVLPDPHHVPNGCFLSALAYVARFRAAHPGERAEVLAVELRRFHGAHTIAVVTWRGEWWGRDEFFGVFPLGRSAARHREAGALTGRAETALERHAEAEVRAGRGAWAPPPQRTMPAGERARAVAEAAALLPEPGEIFRVAGKDGAVPLLFFRPFPGTVCIYEPVTGTAQADTAATHAPSIVKAMAARLGLEGTVTGAEPRPRASEGGRMAAVTGQ
jgi:hypothetical protein